MGVALEDRRRWISADRARTLIPCAPVKPATPQPRPEPVCPQVRIARQHRGGQMPRDAHDLVFPQISEFKWSGNPLMAQIVPTKIRERRCRVPKRVDDSSAGFDRENTARFRLENSKRSSSS